MTYSKDAKMHAEMHDPDGSCCRKTFLGGVAAAGAALAFGMLAPARISAAPQAGAGIHPDAALARLKSGNHVFVETMTTTRTQTIAERAALGAGQAPWASILTCADSRLAPEIIFNTGLGDIFVARVAGNVPDPAETASLEYGSAVLGSQLIVVMGHSSCGAVKSTIEAAGGAKMPSADLERLVAGIMPAVRSVRGEPGDELVNATKANVLAGVRHLQANALLKDLAAHGKLKIAGAYYDLSSGKVSWLA
jgi:carbonic anhydrase